MRLSKIEELRIGDVIHDNRDELNRTDCTGIRIVSTDPLIGECDCPPIEEVWGDPDVIQEILDAGSEVDRPDSVDQPAVNTDDADSIDHPNWGIIT